MNTIATYFPQMDLRLRGIEATGNSEGAKLGWDKRGRGKKAKAPSARHAAVRAMVNNPEFNSKPKEVIDKISALLNDVKDEPIPVKDRAKHWAFWTELFAKTGDWLQRLFGIGLMEATIHLHAIVTWMASGGAAATLHVVAAHALPILAHVASLL